MKGCQRASRSRRCIALVLAFCAVLFILSGCGEEDSPPAASSTPALAARQTLTFPNVGTTDLATLDPARDLDTNSRIAVTMLYSGLVRTDSNLNVIPDQAAWKISADGKVYTFHIRPDVKFADGTPLTAQSYVSSWTRALRLPGSNHVLQFAQIIAGARDVSTGKAKTLTGVKALNSHTLQVTLTHPAPYFLTALTNPFFFPVNQKMIDHYGPKSWMEHVEGNGLGTGPFMVQRWERNVKMVFVPNPYYYGNRTRLTEVTMTFVNDAATAFKTYRARQGGDFIWGLQSADQAVAKGLSGFIRVPLLQTNALFFDTTTPPFDNAAVRQAFAYATDRSELAHAIFKDTVLPTTTILPPGMPGYQPGYSGLPFDKKKAASLLQSVYPSPSAIPSITFSYPVSEMTGDEAWMLQEMWRTTLGIQVNMRPVEDTAYKDELQRHLIQFGLVAWQADFPDPYDCLAVNLFSHVSANNGRWSNASFDQAIEQAESLNGEARLMLYGKAERIAVEDAAWLPLLHETMAAVIPPWIHGVTVNGNGLYFGDWSDVYILAH
ncbi:MAG: peptide ABC transporter substrate-binding protein [Ktedonobacteraceae bacterium]|nr:peptide ABC transporter substrate-binding protein [Ktedonobacteraceae bacterium]